MTALRRPAIASHRGGARLWPENSLTAFRAALRLPAEQLELDVHLTADDAPVVLHDATLDRTTDGAGPVRARSLAALGAVRLRGVDERPPTLAEATGLVADAGRVLRLELKPDAAGRPYPGAVARCLEVLDAAGARPRTVLIAFQPATVLAAARAGGLAGVGLLLDARAWRGMSAEGAAALGRACGATELGLPLAEWDAAAVAALRAAGFALGAWGADDAPGIERGLALDLDVLTTDDPPLALRLRAARVGP